MYKTIFCILLVFMFAGCVQQDSRTNNSSVTKKQNDKSQKFVFERKGTSFGVNLTSDWKASPQEHNDVYINEKQLVSLVFMVMSKSDYNKLASKGLISTAKELPNYLLESSVQKVKSETSLKEYGSPLVYTVGDKTIKRLAYEMESEGMQLSYVLYLIEFKDSDKFLIVRQEGLAKDWSAQEEHLKEMVSSVHIEQDNK